MLTDKQEKFVQEYIANGGKQGLAYKAAYNTARMKEATISNNAYMLMQNSEIAARIQEIKDEVKRKAAEEGSDAASMKLFILDTLKKIASGEMCEETTEYDKDDNVIRRKRVIKSTDRMTATLKLAEFYGIAPETNQNSEITVTLKGLEEYAD